jgi:hypothetical protein
MKPGDIVQLKQPFQPELDCQQKFSFGVIAGRAPNKRAARSDSTESDSLLLHLYDPQTSLIYTDGLGAKAVYLFELNEVEYCCLEELAEPESGSTTNFVE